MKAIDLTDIHAFLITQTPDAWLQSALHHQELLLIDHAHCEKKAAATALSLINRYPQYPDLLYKMSRLAREELRHFEKVLAIMHDRQISFTHLSPSRYAQGLRLHVRGNDPQRLVDMLIIGAFIEARSCERFARVAPMLDQTLRDFYQTLLRSEARHFMDYLTLARRYAGVDIDSRIEFFRQIETDLIVRPDAIFRFHSGPVTLAMVS